MADVLEIWDFDDLSDVDNTDVSTLMTRYGFRAASDCNWRNTTPPPRTGAGSIQIQNGARYKTPANQSRLGVSFAYTPNTGLTGAVSILKFEFEDGADNVQVDIQRNLNGAIVAKDSGGTIIATSTPHAIDGGSNWNFLHVLVTCDNAVGSVQVIANGTEVLNATGIDTQSQASSTINQIHLTGNLGPLPYYADVVVWTDATIPFVGDLTCPGYDVTADGDQNDMTPTSGANYTNVDENVPDDATSIVESDLANDIDLFEVADADAGITTIHAVKTAATATETVSGTLDLQVLQKLNTTTNNSPSRTLTTNYERHSSIRNVNPEGNAWTVADFSATQHGVELV